MNPRRLFVFSGNVETQVNILSMQSSKSLEFRSVIFIGLDQAGRRSGC